jgi:enoyl-[acyl-carrier protein] reductase III
MAGPFSLEGRNAVVTGGTRGIGRAISLHLARAGANVIANYVRNEAAARELAVQAVSEDLPITTCRADLTSPKGLDQLESALTAQAGGLHAFVHCAATGVHKSVEDLSLRHYDWTFALNVRAFLDLLKRCLPRFAEKASVVAVSSQGSGRVLPMYGLVGASKGALESLARHLAVDLAPRGVRVNILTPGPVATGAWGAMPGGEERLGELERRTPLGRLVTPDDVALTALFLCCDAARSIIGQTVVVDGGLGLPL